MHGATGLADASCEGLADGMHAAKSRQQAGMNVEQSALEGADQSRGHDPHPASHHHQFHRRVLQGLHHRRINGVAAVKTGVINQLTGNPQLFGPFLGATTRRFTISSTTCKRGSSRSASTRAWKLLPEPEAKTAKRSGHR